MPAIRAFILAVALPGLTGPRFLLPHAVMLAVALLHPAPAAAMDWSDPHAVGLLPAPGAAGSITGVSRLCPGVDAQRPLGIADVVDRVLCASPHSQEAWAHARFQAAQVGVARAPFLPGVGVDASLGRDWSETEGGPGRSANRLSASASLSYLLYDFGGREVALENARQLFRAASASQDSVVQGLFLAAIQGYYQVHAAQAAVESALEAERAAQASLDAATVRHRVGVGTPADRLQAQTAHSQAVLNRIRAEGELRTARGTLASLMGLDADQPYVLAPVPAEPAYDDFQANVGELIAEARRSRPDLAAAEARVRAAQAGIDAARAAGKPSVTLSTHLGYADRQFGPATRSGGIGLSITVPLFTGFASTYRIRAAQEQAAATQAARDRLRLQIALDVWNAYQTLQTETQSVRTSRDLVASAERNAEMALGRYKAGVGNIIDLITAQAALASARAQRIQATFSWDIARAGLVYAMGLLDDVPADTVRAPTLTETKP